MRVLILGATGRLGGRIVDEALSRDVDVTALVRSPKKLEDRVTRVRIVLGDALRSEDVAAATTGQDAVVFALGTASIRPTTLFSDSTRVLIAAMATAGVRRLIAVTGVGAGETRGHGGFLYDHVLFPLFTKRIYEDKDRQEAMIRHSSLDWTIVRPASFRQRQPRGQLRVVTDVGGVVLRRVSIDEVAAFILDELLEPSHVREAVFIGHE